jgi:ectoine hydroxylase-related dioxygenase (phytanoyl-CoA dioxygenase family)
MTPSTVQSPLPDLSSEYPLTPEQIASYQRDGHILLRGVCSPEEAAAYRAAILDATMRHNRETRPLEERDTYGKAFLQVMNLWTVDEGVRKYTLARRFAHIAAQLMQADGVRLYHDQALFKEPGGGLTPWHQDQFYWPLATPTTVTMWMPLVDISEVMGSMTFADASHTEGFVPISAQISDDSEQYFDDFVRGKGYRLTGGGEMKAGDATFHSGYTLHRAPGNVTDRTREVMTVIYYPDGTRVQEPANDFQKADLATWLDSKPAGALADGPLNPVLYP